MWVLVLLINIVCFVTEKILLHCICHAHCAAESCPLVTCCYYKKYLWIIIYIYLSDTVFYILHIYIRLNLKKVDIDFCNFPAASRAFVAFSN